MEQYTSQLTQRYAAICSRNEKCKYDAYVYLKNKGVESDEIECAIQYLVVNKFIDDSRYAEAFVADKYKFAKWGREKIKQQLRLKRIQDNIITSAIGNVIDKDNELQIIKNEIQKKFRTIKSEDNKKIKEKLLRFAIGRGYPYEACIAVINKITNI